MWAFTSIASVREILVLRSDRIAAQLLRRGADGGWPRDHQPVTGTLVLERIGFAVAMAELYARTGRAG